MASLRAVVLEDEWSARSYLVELLHETSRVSVVAAFANAEQAMQAIDAGLALEVAFVDVNLAGSPHDDSGMRWVRQLASRATKPRIVLTTASDRYAIEAYSLGVQDYLLKPFTSERVEQCVQRLLSTAEPVVTPSVQRIAARNGTRLVFVPLEELWAFEASSRLSFVHTKRGRFDVDLSLSALEASLGSAVLRVHRNWLVAAAQVRSFDREEGEHSLLVGEEGSALRVPVARDRASVVREVLLDASIGVRKT